MPKRSGKNRDSKSDRRFVQGVGIVTAMLLAFWSVSLYHFFSEGAVRSVSRVSGAVTASSHVSLCMEAPVPIDPVSAQTATVGSEFTYQLTLADNGTTNFAITPAVFSINSSGLIQFTPTTAQLGVTYVVIVNASTVCGTPTSTQFNLTVVEGTNRGGGGGGGGSEVSPQYERVTIPVNNGPIVSVSFTAPSSDIRKGITVRVRELLTLPSSMEQLPVAYTYFELLVDNLPEDISASQLEFGVPSSWLAARDIHPSDVVLFHGQDGTGWKVVNTVPLPSEGAMATFRATGLTFKSYFAISVKAGVRVLSLCANGQLDTEEEEMDCGGPCSPCSLKNPCYNGAKDPGEEEIDCGGSCGPCLPPLLEFPAREVRGFCAGTMHSTCVSRSLFVLLLAVVGMIIVQLSKPRSRRSQSKSL